MAPPARAHIPPVADIEIALQEDEAQFRIATIDQLMATWLDLPLAAFDQRTPRQVARVRARAQRLVDRESTVLLNGVEVRGEVETIEVTEHEYDVLVRRITTLVLRYRGKGRVRALAMQWRALRGIEVLNASYIEGVLKGFGEERSFQLAPGRDTLFWRPRADRAMNAVLSEIPGRLHTASLDVEIGDGDVTAMVYVPLATVRDLLPLRDDFTIAPADLERALEQMRAFCDRALAVRVDDMPVRPIPLHVEVEFAMGRQGGAHVAKSRLRYPAPGAARRVSVAWQTFSAEREGPLPLVPLRVVAAGEEATGELRPEEPEWIWHAPARPGSAPSEPRQHIAPATSGSTQQRSDLVVAAVLAGLALLALGLASGLLVRASPRARLGAGALGLVCIAALLTQWSGVGPWGAARHRSPLTDEEARTVFRALLINNYRAFDYRSEDEIYDTLSQSVVGDLLREVYLDIHESLIQREQGGAVSRVQSVDLLSSDVRWPDRRAGDRFDVSSRWRVRGVVEHWGHAHTRVNEYRAAFTVRRLGEGWRIAAMQVVDQQRVDSVDGGAPSSPAGIAR